MRGASPRAFGCEHHELELSVLDDTLGLDELVWHLDEPVADLSALGFDTLSRLAAEHVTVALAGQGADELFGGYPKHRAAAALQRVDAVPGSLRRALAGVPWPSGKARRFTKALAGRDASERLLAMSGRLGPETRASLYRGEPRRGRRADGVHDGRGRPRRRERGRALRHSSTSTRGSRSSTTCSCTSTSRRWPTRSRCACRSSTTGSSSGRRRCLRRRRSPAARRSAFSATRQRGSCRRRRSASGRSGSSGSRSTPGSARSLPASRASGSATPTLPYRELLSGDAVERSWRGYLRQPTEDRARLVLAILLLESWLSTFTGRALAAAQSSR